MKHLELGKKFQIMEFGGEGYNGLMRNVIRLMFGHGKDNRFGRIYGLSIF